MASVNKCLAHLRPFIQTSGNSLESQNAASTITTYYIYFLLADIQLPNLAGPYFFSHLKWTSVPSRETSSTLSHLNWETSLYLLPGGGRNRGRSVVARLKWGSIVNWLLPRKAGGSDKIYPEITKLLPPLPFLPFLLFPLFPLPPTPCPPPPRC